MFRFSDQIVLYLMLWTLLFLKWMLYFMLIVICQNVFLGHLNSKKTRSCHMAFCYICKTTRKVPNLSQKEKINEITHAMATPKPVGD